MSTKKILLSFLIYFLSNILVLNAQGSVEGNFYQNSSEVHSTTKFFASNPPVDIIKINWGNPITLPLIKEEQNPIVPLPYFVSELSIYDECYNDNICNDIDLDEIYVLSSKLNLGEEEYHTIKKNLTTTTLLTDLISETKEEMDVLDLVPIGLVFLSLTTNKWVIIVL